MSKSKHNSTHRVLLVTYDLAAVEDDKREGLFEALQRCPGWCHYLEATWLVCTGETPRILLERLQPFLGDSDSILIIEVRANYFGLLPDKAWSWINKHVPRADQGELIPHEHKPKPARTGRVKA
jgi:hypothetical protein